MVKISWLNGVNSEEVGRLTEDRQMLNSICYAL